MTNDRHRIRHWRRRAAFAALIGSGLALAARLVGDVTVVTSIIIYSTPWLVMAVAGLLVIKLGQPWWRWMGLLPLGWGVFTAVGSWCPPRIEPIDKLPQGVLTVATWNAGRKLPDSPHEWHFDADIVAIIEAGSFDETAWSSFQTKTPDYSWHRTGTGMMLGLRSGTLLHFEAFGKPGYFRAQRALVEVKTNRVVLVLADIHSQPWLLRAPSVRSLFNAADSETAIVLGDFNTPPESRSFDSPRMSGFQLANQRQNGGFAETWPYGIPLLTLDHIWVGPAISVVSARQELRNSDHALIAATVAVDEPQRPPE